MIGSNLYLHMFLLYFTIFTFSNVFTTAYEVYLFYLFISVIISWADLFSYFWFYSPCINSSSKGRILSTKNFLSSWGFFFTFSLRTATSWVKLVRSLWKMSCNLVVSVRRFWMTWYVQRQTKDVTWRCLIVLQQFYSYRYSIQIDSTFVQLINYIDRPCSKYHTIIIDSD